MVSIMDTTNTTTTTVELTGDELATLMDATREHGKVNLESGLRNDHPIFATLESLRTKLDTAMINWETERYGPAS